MYSHVQYIQEVYLNMHILNMLIPVVFCGENAFQS